MPARQLESDEAASKRVGTVRVRNGFNEFSIRCNAFAADIDDSVRVLSGIGPHTAVKAIAAMFGMSVKDRAKVEITLAGPMSPCRVGSYSVYRVSKDHGYAFYRHRIAGSWWHLLAISEDSALMPQFDERNLWRILRSERFTTPVLRQWTPYIMQQLLDKRKLRKLDGFQCSPAIITAEDEHIDKIVSDGIRNNLISIE